MPVKINEFVIQAKFEGEENDVPDQRAINPNDLLALKEEIMYECLEKVEALLQKKEGR